MVPFGAFRGFFDQLGSLGVSFADFATAVGSLGFQGVRTVVEGNRLFVGLMDSGVEKFFEVVPDDAWGTLPIPGASVLVPKFGDELIMLGPRGVGRFELIPGEADVVARLGLQFAEILGAVRRRRLRSEEWELAEWVFGPGNLGPRSKIILTSLKPITPEWDFPPIAVGKQEAQVVPLDGGSMLINMGDHYVHEASIEDGALLLHELTHVWQIRRDILREISLINVIIADGDYDYVAGERWSDYNIEEQGRAIQDWANGQINSFVDSVFGDLSPVSPLFDYVHRNLRPFDNDAPPPMAFDSLRARLSPGTSLAEHYGRRPAVWWLEP